MVKLKDKIKTRKMFNRWSSSWSEKYSGYNFQAHNFQERKKKVLSLLDMIDGNYLDAGCGTGSFLESLSGNRRQIFAFDGSYQMAEETQRQHGKENDVHIFVGDIENIPADDNIFDAIICVGVLEYLPEDNESIKEMYRVLKDGGTLVITVPNKLSFFMILDQLIIWGLTLTGKVLDWLGLYRLIRGRKRINEVRSFHKHYIISRFNQLVRSYKFQIVKEDWCTFGSMFLGNYIPLSEKISSFLERCNFSAGKFLALNYIVKIRK